MRLVHPLPTSIESDLATRLPPGEQVRIKVPTDLSESGQYEAEWLVVTTERLLIYRPQAVSNGSTETDRRLQNGHASEPTRWAVKEYPVREVSKAETEPLVGGGRLRAVIGGQLVDLVYFSAGLAARFGDAARAIQEIANGKEPPLSDEEDRTRCEKCGRLLPEPNSVCPACVQKAAVLLRLASYVKPYWPAAASLAALSLTSTAAQLIPPALTRVLVDRVLVPKEHLDWLLWLALALIGVGLVESAAGLAHGWIVAWLSARVTHDIRAHIYRRLERLSLRFYDKRQIGAIMSRVTNDSDRLQGFLVEGLPYLISNVILLLGIVTALLIMDWRLALLALAPAPLLVGGGAAFFRRMRRMWSTWSQKYSNFSAYLNESITGIKVVKAFAQESREIGRLDQRNSELYGISVRADRMWFAFFSTMGFLTGAGTFLVWLVGGQSVFAGEVTLGELLAFIAYMGILFRPLQWLSQLNNWMTRALAGAERIFEVIDAQNEPYSSPQATSVPHIRGEVELKNVTFGYDRYKPVLKEVSLKVKAGEMIGLVGKSGVGKTTLINLLCRFYDPQEGEILIDGLDARQIRLEDLRSQIGIVLQEPFLFNGTIAANIAYARPEATRQEIIAAARAGNAHNFILAKADGYDTQVGERGTRLSVGERQRISIARAILHNPRILILDEATASVDTETERQIQEAIARLIEGRTTFAIAHRLSTLRNASRLVVIDEGKVAEVGTHDELLARRGIYRRLVDMQTQISKLRAIVAEPE